ncbi:uncharacterized protein N7496_004952 [Penicillium cataractarum]|uniref:Uncharacterized protein n=1 Tax=Penicillium cataractarum TaxID=2100454 RepID=A0A9W9VCZ4_9EURO|nr:uncharacterized protein N7496_004952 [Penicillium cataractarum]KAJ5377543.1 hypothetical protein N7496_004952 [Penicillium cataractarum]
MDRGDNHCPGELDALHADWNRSGSTICLPSPSPLKRASTYLPKAGPKVLEESNTDPFYLEQSLAATPSAWNSYNPAIRDERFSDDNSNYYSLSLTHQRSTSDLHKSSRQFCPDRSTIAQLELENNLRFHRYTSSTEEETRPLHSSHESFSSVQTGSTTPDLTPSSSFSSTYSASCPDAVIKATEKLYHHAKRAQSEPRRAFYLPASTPPTQLPPPPPVPALPKAQTRPTTPSADSANTPSTSTMKYELSGSMSSSSRRRKPHPTLPNLSRRPSSHSSRRKQSSPGTRPPLDPSMISPPSLINPVTMEPHATHFEQALFIPANDCPSPIPSPSASSPPISRQWTATSMERPSTSTMDAYCEHSVWESDSDNESIGHKSLSRKPIDTLRKVRSRAKLRAAKSQPRLHQAMLDDEAPEKFPCMPDDAVGHPVPEPYRGVSLDRPSTSRDGLRPNHPLQTLRLVAPSTTSLLKPRSRNNSNGNLRDSDIDRSTAAAVQARSRRRQQSDSSEYIKEETDKLTSMCYEQHSPIPFEDPIDQRPFFKRVLDSLRSLSCHKAATKTTTTI